MIDLNSRLDDDNVRKLIASSINNAADEKIEQACEVYRKDPRAILFGYEKSGKVLGCVGVRIEERSKAVIQHIAVDYFYRKHGIAKEMINFVLEHLKLKLLTAEAGSETAGFYKVCGFQVESLGKKETGDERFWCTLSKY